MNEELQGKVALVTGAGQGIGEQVARRLASAGARVCVSDIDATQAERVADDIGGVAHVGDLTAPGACDAAVEQAVGLGGLDIVVNNAGYSWDGPIHKLSDEAFDAMLAIHTVVPFRVLRAAAPHLREPAKAERQRGEEVFRKVVNVSSLSGAMGNAGQVAYAAGKAGAIGLTRALAKEWGPFKICVNAIAFGAVETRLTGAADDGRQIDVGGRSIALGVSEQARQAMTAAIPFGRAATADEAARGIYFLCSPLSDYVHGQVLNVSGGVVAGMTT